MAIDFVAKAADSGVHEGVSWAIVPAPLYGRMNGYVRVPDGHPWRKHAGATSVAVGREVASGYDQIQPLAESDPAFEVLIAGARELTYSDENGWVGFDTLHLCDDEAGWTPDGVASMAKVWAGIVARAGRRSADGF